MNILNTSFREILKLLDQGLTHQEVAEKLQISVGKVRYQLYKKRQKEIQQESIKIEDAEVHPWYGEDQLVLLPQNPTSLYAYWEITGERKRLVEEHFGCAWEALPKILRVYDVTDIYFNGDNAHYYTDVPVNDYANNWFIHQLGPNRNYCVDFGTRTWEGHYFTILRSDVVNLPPSDVQAWREHEKWTRPAETEEPGWLREFTGYTIHKG